MLCRILEQWIRPPVVLLMVILAKHYIQERKVQNQNKYPLQLENVLYTEEMIQYIQSAVISLAGYSGELLPNLGFRVVSDVDISDTQQQL